MIYVNGRFLIQKASGVQRFALEICREFLNADISFCFVLPARGTIQQDVPEGFELRRFGRLSGHAWEQIELPSYLRSVGSPLLLNLGNTAPILYPNKVSTIHDIAVVRCPRSFSFPFRLLYSLLIPRVIRSSRTVVTVSEFSRKEISSYFAYPPDRIEVIPNAVAKDFGAKASTEPRIERPYFLSVSSIEPRKNIPALLDAFNILSHETVELKIAGSWSKIFATQNSRTPNERVTFLGYVDDDELVRLYRGALAFVYPPKYEGFGIPPLEAMACGCPVIASQIPPIQEVCGDAALYFDPEDIQSIRYGMETVARDAELRAKLIERGRRTVASFSWSASASKLIRVLDKHGTP